MKNIINRITLSLLILGSCIGQSMASSETEIEIIDAKETFRDFVTEIKTNNELRKLIRLSRKKKNNEDRQLLTKKVHAFFKSKGITLGYFESGFYTSVVFLFMGFEQGLNDEDNWGAEAFSYGPGAGFSIGFRLTGCTFKRSPTLDLGNWGVKATAIIGVGITSSFVFGENGMCINIGSAVGFEAHLGLEQRIFYND